MIHKSQQFSKTMFFSQHKYTNPCIPTFISTRHSHAAPDASCQLTTSTAHQYISQT